MSVDIHMLESTLWSREGGQGVAMMHREVGHEIAEDSNCLGKEETLPLFSLSDLNIHPLGSSREIYTLFIYFFVA